MQPDWEGDGDLLGVKVLDHKLVPGLVARDGTVRSVTYNPHPNYLPRACDESTRVDNKMDKQVGLN
jgi:hypothetical protein